MGKPTICIGENKGADQLRSNCEADQRLCFRYTDSKIPQLSKSKILQPLTLCQTWSEPELLVFSRTGSFIYFYCPVGRGIDGLITGTLFDPDSGLGAVWTFRLYGFIALAVMVVYIVANVTIFRRPLHMHAPRNMSIEIDQDKSGTIKRQQRK